ncbi:Atg29 protein [Maudiozyma humilis]|uniref:Autophagy-related protein 29 n=1 Tax=Maudiozyma humilis TaxID=51915 RepID=A0AAV5S2Q7_MAUHU|nr:Atg29 protein [Kazachstania humilis]
MNNDNTVIYVKVAGPRPANFIDPAPFEWNNQKEKRLWDYISNIDSKNVTIDWDELSESLSAPSYFLKKRSQTLFASHLKLLRQQLNKKKKILQQDKSIQSTSDIITSQENVNIETPFVQGSLEEQQSGHTTDFESSSINVVPGSINSKEDIDEKVLKQMQTSKLLAIHAPLRDSDVSLSDDALIGKHEPKEDIEEHSDNNESVADTHKSTVEDDDGDLSSNLSVSKSALEEALMARLNF